MKKLQQRGFIYEWLEIGICLSVVGGFLDSYTFISRGGVFANAQTGNLVLMCLKLAGGEGVASLRYLIPIFFFMVGVLLTEHLKRIKRRGEDHFFGQCFVISAEVAALTVVGFLNEQVPDMLVNAMVSLVAAMQFNSFRKMEGLPFATAFCTGNLRSTTELIYAGFSRKDKKAFLNAFYYFLVILFFCGGVFAGAHLTWLLGRYSIWCIAGFLLLLLAYMSVCHGIVERRKRAACPQQVQ